MLWSHDIPWAILGYGTVGYTDRYRLRPERLKQTNMMLDAKKQNVPNFNEYISNECRPFFKAREHFKHLKIF